MPRDRTMMRQFMVDLIHIDTDKVIQTLGPFSEDHARKVANQWEVKDARVIPDIRRAKDSELEQ